MPLNDGIITTTQITNSAISQSKLKTSLGSWNTNINGNNHAYVNLVDFSFFPKQAISPAGSIRLWYNGYGGTTQAFTLIAYADSTAGTWTGTYRYVSASEQMIEVYRDNLGKIIGIHVTEKENSNSIKIFDENKKEIPLILETMDFQTHPHLFKDKQCIEVASKLHKILQR